MDQRNEVFFIFSKIKIDILNMKLFIKRIFASFMLSVQVRMIVLLRPDKKVFISVLVDCVNSDSVNQKPQSIIPPSFNTFKSDVNIFDFDFEIIHNPEDVLFNNGV